MESAEIEIAQAATPKPLLLTRRLFSLNQQIPSLFLLAQSTIAYLAGCSFLIQNVGTLQQELIWVAKSHHQVLKMENNIASYGPVKVCLLLWNCYERVMEFVVFGVDWAGCRYRRREERWGRLEGVGVGAVVKLKFDGTGEYLCITCHENDNSFLSVYPTSSPTQTPQKHPLPQPPHLLQSHHTKSPHTYTLIYPTSIQLRNKEGQLLLTETCIYEDEQYGLLQGERVLHVEWRDGWAVGDVLCFVLGDRGSLAVWGYGERGFQGLLRVDVRVQRGSMRMAGQVQREQQSAKSSTTIKFISQPYLLPTCINITNNRILLAYPQSRKLLLLTYSQHNPRNYSHSLTPNKIYLPFQSHDHNHDHDPQEDSSALDLWVEMISVSTDLCSVGFIVRARGYLYAVVVDGLGLLVGGIGEGGGDRLCANYGCRGVCRFVAYLERESALFVLFENSSKQTYLSYYKLPYPNHLSQKPPNSLQLWSTALKSPSHSLSPHPLNSTLLILHPEQVRIHYYTAQHLSENYININIPGCECGAYSPLGDKIVVCNVSGVWVLDAYRVQVRSFVAGWAGLVGKVPRGIVFVGGWDAVVEYGVGASSYLLQLCDYSKIKMLGQVCYNTCSPQIQTLDQNITNLFTKTYIPPPPSCQPSPNTLQLDPKHNLIAYILPGHQLRFYNLNLQILNILTIQPTCLHLNREMEILFVGTQRGELYMFKWPDIVDKVSNIKEIDPEVVAVLRVHCGAIVAVEVMVNLRFILVVSQTGEISFLEFLQENSANISRQGALAMLKKSNLKPSLETCLTSTSDQNKRTQAIIKAIGKQVEVNKKNEKTCTDLIEQLQRKIREEKFRTELMIKDEIQCSAEERRVRDLVRKIEGLREELGGLGRRREVEGVEEKERFQRLLTDNFREKSLLEKELKDLQARCKVELEATKVKLEQQLKQTQFAQSSQLQIIAEDSKSHSKMYQKMHGYNKLELYRLQEQKLEQESVLAQEYNLELEQLHQRRNELQNSIRKYLITIQELNSKNTNLGLQAMEIKEDLAQIGKFRIERAKGREEVQRKLEEVKIRSQLLIAENREVEIGKERMEKKADFVQERYQKLIMEIKKLEASDEEIKNKKLDLDGSFYEENRRRIYLNTNIEAMRERVIELKERRDKIKRDAVVNSKKLARSLHASPSTKPHQKANTKSFHWNNFIKQPHLHQLSQNLQIRDSTNEKLQKLNRIKNQKIKKYSMINSKLINDHKRLISQLNQLKRYNDFLVKKEGKLKLQIKYGSLYLPGKENQGKRDNESGAGLRLNKVGLRRMDRMRKGVVISLHQDGSIGHGEQLQTPINY